MHGLINKILSTITRPRSLARKIESVKFVRYEFDDVIFRSYHDKTFTSLRKFLKIKDFQVEHSFYYNPNIKGNSSSLIFYTADFKFVIKLLNNNEFETLLNITEDYATYVVINPSTLLVKILACHEILYRNKNVKFIIMKNIFETLAVCDIFDLKGYKLVRKEDQLVKKENDWINERYTILTKRRDMILQISKDCRFLRNHDIMDYSLVISVNNRIKNKFFANTNLHGVRHIFEDEQLTDEQFSLGITDILTSFNYEKQFEFLYNLVCCNENKSCKGNEGYYTKFMDMIKRIIVIEHMENNSN